MNVDVLQFDRPTQHLARVDGRLVEGAGEEHVGPDQAVLGVDEQCHEHLARLAAQRQCQIIVDGGGVVQHELVAPKLPKCDIPAPHTEAS